jgi:hypothetical protein
LVSRSRKAFVVNELKSFVVNSSEFMEDKPFEFSFEGTFTNK